jgi:hypothetical protein
MHARPKNLCRVRRDCTISNRDYLCQCEFFISPDAAPSIEPAPARLNSAMRVFFINLDSEPARRADLGGNFAHCRGEVTSVEAMAQLINRRHAFTSERQISMLDLFNYPFAGATAYIVNGPSKRKLLDLLNRRNDLDTPFDVFLRQLIWGKAIAGFFLFPFVTSLSKHAETSSIQLTDDRARILVWNAFRRMTWIERNLDEERPYLDRISESFCDLESALFSVLFAAMISKRSPFGRDSRY